MEKITVGDFSCEVEVTFKTLLEIEQKGYNVLDMISGELTLEKAGILFSAAVESTEKVESGDNLLNKFLFQGTLDKTIANLFTLVRRLYNLPTEKKEEKHEEVAAVSPVIEVETVPSTKDLFEAIKQQSWL